MASWLCARNPRLMLPPPCSRINTVVFHDVLILTAITGLIRHTRDTQGIPDEKNNQVYSFVGFRCKKKKKLSVPKTFSRFAAEMVYSKTFCNRQNVFQWNSTINTPQVSRFPWSLVQTGGVTVASLVQSDFCHPKNYFSLEMLSLAGVVWVKS